MQYLSIKNFETFQHYRTRRPPWIKLYQTLLEDYAFTRLSDNSKWHLIGLFLLASRYDNRVPYDLPWITSETKSASPVDIDELVIAGFVTVCDARTPLAPRKQSASKPRAARKQSAMIEKEKEREGEKELPARGQTERTTWVTPYAQIWSEVYGPGSVMPVGRNAKELRAAEIDHGPPETAARWRRYLRRTKPHFATAVNFRATWGTLGEESEPRIGLLENGDPSIELLRMSAPPRGAA